jgi:endonuclease/exonuclease/phosphatase family metal-dependent hydrolase
MTWNLWWRFGEWQQRQPAILSVLQREQPDLCALQEVWADDQSSQAEWLARELGMHQVFGASTNQQRWRDRVNDPTAQFGVALLSRWPIRDVQVHDLPLDDSRPALSAFVDAPHATVPLITTHLSALPMGGTARRIQQVEWLARHVASLPQTDHPPIVTGDFNAEPESDEIRRFGGILTAPIVEGQVFVDAWRYADPADPGYTWDRANPYVAAGFEYSARIDYIHVVPRHNAPGAITSVRRTATAPENGIWPSDHAAVIATLTT